MKKPSSSLGTYGMRKSSITWTGQQWRVNITIKLKLFNYKRLIELIWKSLQYFGLKTL